MKTLLGLPLISPKNKILIKAPFLSFLLSFLLLSISSIAQNIKLKTVKQEFNGILIEYQIDKETKLKEGDYKYYFNKNLLISGSHKNNERHELWKFYNLNDTLQIEGHYLDGKKNGEWKSYYSSGQISCIENFSNNLRNGQQTGYYKNGSLSFKKEYKSDTIIGEEILFYSKGKPQKIRHYEKGELAHTKSFFENGVIKEEEIIVEGKRDSIYKSFYGDGSTMAEIIYRKGGIWNVLNYNKKDGTPFKHYTISDGTGLIRFFNNEGQLEEEAEYKDLKRNGKTRYFKNGQLISEGFYIDDFKEGVWKFYNKEGKLEKEAVYRNNKLNGQTVMYNDDGSYFSIGKYVDNKKHGDWIYYNSKGTKESQMSYSMGIAEGEAYFFEKGLLVRSGTYKFNTGVDYWKYYRNLSNFFDVIDYGSPDSAMYFKNTAMTYEDIVEGKLTGEIIVERMPYFQGGDNGLYKFLWTNLRYPPGARDYGIVGTVYVRFIVSKTGEISQITIERGAQKDLDIEAIEVVKILPRFSVGMANGQPVPVEFTLPLKFVIK